MDQSPPSEQDWENYAREVERAHREGVAPPLPPGPLFQTLWHERYCANGCRCSLSGNAQKVKTDG